MELPLFPLQLVLFPGRPLPLHLFEPRYRQMLGDCLAGERRFGVVAIRSGREVGAPATTYSVGTVAHIEQVAELPDGRFDITTRGGQRFRILSAVNGHAYAAAEVELLDEQEPADDDLAVADHLRALLAPYLRMLGAPEELLERLPRSADELSFLAAATVQVDLVDQQRLLELDDVGDRLRAVVALLRRETSLMRHFGTVGSLRPPGPGGAELN